MFTSSRSVRRLASVAATAAVALSLAACTDQGQGTQSAPTTSGTHSGDTTAQSAGGSADNSEEVQHTTPNYPIKRGELPDPLKGDEWVHGANESASDKDMKLPVTAVFHDVRGGEHDGFYRVIVEFKRDSDTAKRTEGQELRINSAWAPEPVSQGKGDRMENSGQKFLDVKIANTTTPMTPELDKLYYAGEKNLTFGPIDVSIDGTYEGNTHVVIGMDKEREYQVSVLNVPTRVVIDIKK